MLGPGEAVSVVRLYKANVFVVLNYWIFNVENQQWWRVALYKYKLGKASL